MAFILVFVVFLAILYWYSFRGTIFQFSPSKNRWGGVVYWREIFTLIVMGCIVFEFVDINDLVVVHVTPDSIIETTPYILITICLFIVSVSILSRKIFTTSLVHDHSSQISLSCSENIDDQKNVLYSSAAILVVLISVMLLSGYEHSFIGAVWGDEDLMTIRLRNSYSDALPQHFQTYGRYAVILTAVLLGVTGVNLSNLVFFAIFSLVFYSSSFFGDKSPIVQSILLYFFAKYGNNNSKLMSNWRLFFIAFATLLIAYIVVKVQDADADFIAFMFNRIGIGQIQGVYEQFVLKIQKFDYIYNELPLSGLFINSGGDYSKDIMMNTFGLYLKDNEVGVMNSYFIGEAYAVGGYMFLFLSPIIVAFNVCLVCHLMIHAMMRYFKLNKTVAQNVSVLFGTSIMSLTVDLGGLIFFKKLIGFIPFFVGLYVLVLLISFFRRKRIL